MQKSRLDASNAATQKEKYKRKIPIPQQQKEMLLLKMQPLLTQT